MTTLPDTVAAWARTQAINLRQDLLTGRFSHTDQQGRHLTPEDDAVRWVIEALCDGACPWAGAVREHIDRVVAGHREAA